MYLPPRVDRGIRCVSTQLLSQRQYDAPYHLIDTADNEKVITAICLFGSYHLEF